MIPYSQLLANLREHNLPPAEFQAAAILLRRWRLEPHVEKRVSVWPFGGLEYVQARYAALIFIGQARESRYNYLAIVGLLDHPTWSQASCEDVRNLYRRAFTLIKRRSNLPPCQFDHDGECLVCDCSPSDCPFQENQDDKKNQKLV